MARESTISFDQVAAAADIIKTQGGKPTARSVREALGSGSMATVLKFLQQWQGGQVRQNQAIDDTLDPAIVRAISNAIASKVQEATADATVRLADLQAETSSVIVENERMGAEIDSLTADLAALQEQLAATAGRAQQLEVDAARQATELVAERAAAEAARVALAKAELRLESVPRIEAELVAVRAELAAERVKSAEQHEAAAVAIAQREAAEKANVRLNEQLAEVTKRATSTTEQLAFEKISNQACQARLEAAAREISAAQEAATTARSAAKKAGEEAAELRGQLKQSATPAKVPAAKRVAK